MMSGSHSYLPVLGPHDVVVLNDLAGGATVITPAPPISVGFLYAVVIANSLIGTLTISGFLDTSLASKNIVIAAGAVGPIPFGDAPFVSLTFTKTSASDNSQIWALWRDSAKSYV